MPETTTAERTRVLEWSAAYAHVKDYWERSGRALTAMQEQVFARAVAAQKEHGITDAEINAHRATHKTALDAFAAGQA